MLHAIKQNILFLIFIVLTLNIVALTGINAYSVISRMPLKQDFETIDCGDATGRIHKCIRIDPKAGEINDAAKGASYRVIYGQ
jgi:hypothetical protein